MSSSVLRAAAATNVASTCLGSSRTRCKCLTVRASLNEGAHVSSSTARRELLLGATAATAAVAISQLLQPQAARAEPFASVIDNDDDEVVAPAAPQAAEEAAEAPAAAAQQPAPGTLTQVTTPEGNVKLATNDQAIASMTPTDRKVFTLNRRVQAQNRAPDDFPGFIREGFDITIVGEGYQMDPSGLIYKDFVLGGGGSPADGQQVVFDYTGYNESGTIVDSSYRKGRAAEVRLGINGLIPGIELGIKGMKPGGKRRMVVPPALGPPVGPSTFFSAKQCEVFDVELRQVKTCTRRQMAMFSDVVCE